jgi:hypothetical protein
LIQSAFTWAKGLRRRTKKHLFILNRNKYINRILIFGKIFFQTDSDKPFSVQDKRRLKKDRRRLSEDKPHLSEDKRDLSEDKCRLSSDKCRLSSDKCRLSSDKRLCPRQKAVFKEKTANFVCV